ncbi:MAG: TonB-dependent receptor, partial [Gemmatimonadota bacterium]|nr:TonB-dependent receptor [Gemmatimonadota bacterium]
TSLGGTWAPNAGIAIDVEAYRNNVRQLIDTRYEGSNAAGLIVYQNVNVASAHTEGVETSVRLLRGPFDAAFGYDYLYTRDDETRLPLSQRATHTARVHLQREWKLLSGVTTDATAHYTGPSKLIGTAGNSVGVVGQQGEFLSLDGQLRINVSQLAELSVGVNNLLDKRPVFYTPAYQRQFFLGLHVRWSPRD